jgi:type IV pilus assembly protein PilF
LKIAIVGLLLVGASLVSGCSTSSSSETKVADIAGKTTAAQRAQIHTELASEYFRLGKMAVALESANQATKVFPSHAPAYNMLALIHMELQENDKAQAAFEQAIKFAPDDSNVLNNYGWFICQRVDAKRSLVYFERAIKNPLYSSPERALYNGGVCARRAGDLRAAEVNFNATLKRDPQFAPALVELADIAFSQSRFKDADDFFARYNALIREPDANGLLLGAKIARAMNDRNAEAGYIAQLRRRFPESPQAIEASQRGTPR